jgi:hypothetical protein
MKTLQQSPVGRKDKENVASKHNEAMFGLKDSPPCPKKI